MQTNKEILPSPILQPGIKLEQCFPNWNPIFVFSFSIIGCIILIRKDSGCEINQESYLRHVTKVQQLKQDNSFSSVGWLIWKSGASPVYI